MFDLFDILDIFDILRTLKNSGPKKAILVFIRIILFILALFLLYQFLTTTAALMSESSIVYESQVSMVESPDYNFDTGEIEKPEYDVRYEELNPEEKKFFNIIQEKSESTSTIGEEKFETEMKPPRLFVNGVTICDDCGVSSDFESSEDGTRSGVGSVYGYYNINSDPEKIEKGGTATLLHSVLYLIAFLGVILLIFILYIKKDL